MRSQYQRSCVFCEQAHRARVSAVLSEPLITDNAQQKYSSENSSAICAGALAWGIAEEYSLRPRGTTWSASKAGLCQIGDDNDKSNIEFQRKNIN